MVPAVGLVFLLTPSLCNAKLWYTYDQCVARWGQPINMDDASIRALTQVPSSLTSVTFKFFSDDNCHIIVGFLNGTVCLEDIWKKGNATITNDELVATLKVESDGFEWKHDPSSSLWIRADEKVRVIFPPQHEHFTIDTQVFFDVYKKSLKK